MFSKRTSRVNAAFRRLGGAAVASLLLAAGIAAEAADVQSRAASADAPSSVEIVKPGLYRIGDGAGSVLLRSGASGLVVVDSGRAGTYRPLLAAIERIAKSAEPPIRALVLTASGAEQAGNVAQFVEAGVPVIVQERAYARLAADERDGRARGPTSFVTYDTDYLLRVDDVAIEVEHVGRGRTGADSIVVFRDLGVVAVGELFIAGTPEPDCAAGGSFAGWSAAIDHLLWSGVDVVVPSRGAPVGKRELVAFKAKLEALAARAASSPSGPSDCLPPR